MNNIKIWLSSLSFSTGLYVLRFCVICYIISFAQMLLPLPAAIKGVLWVFFFGTAKAAQYSALLILGKSGIEKIRRYLRKRQEQ